METIIREQSAGQSPEQARQGRGGGRSAGRRNGFGRGWWWGAFSLAILAGIGVVWYVVPEGAAASTDGVAWRARVLGTLGWVQSQGLMAAFWLVILQALLVILVIPGPYFTLGAGFIFGLAGGSVVAVAGSVTGAAAAYGIARAARAARGGTSRNSRDAGLPADAQAGGFGRRLAGHPRLRMLERLILLGDWKVILSTRLIPLFPFKLSNYLFGWLRFPFAPFFWGTLFGVIPITMVSVSAGALASDLSGLGNPDLIGGAGWGWSLAALGAGLVLLVWSGRRARALYREAGAAQGAGDAEGEENASRGEVFR